MEHTVNNWTVKRLLTKKNEKSNFFTTVRHELRETHTDAPLGTFQCELDTTMRGDYFFTRIFFYTNFFLHEKNGVFLH